MKPLRMLRTRERQLEERVRLLESQMAVQAQRVAHLEAHAVTKQFARVKP